MARNEGRHNDEARARGFHRGPEGEHLPIEAGYMCAVMTFICLNTENLLQRGGSPQLPPGSG